MKILVNGAFSTGKTTLVASICAFVRARGFRAYSLDETARHCPFPLNKEQSFSGTQWLLHAQISRELAAELDGTIVVVDRGIPDVLAHYMETCERLETNSPEIEALIAYLSMWCGTYDIVFTTSVEELIDIPTDGVRLLDKEFRRRMQVYNQRAMRRMGLPCRHLPYQVQSDPFSLEAFLEEHIGF